MQTTWASARSAIVLLLAAGVGACATVPDVAPFADATVQLRSAVAASGAAVETELRGVPKRTGTSEAEREEAQRQDRAVALAADKLQAAWHKRVQAMDALVVYSDSVQSIAKSGKQGAQAVQALTESLKQLAGAVGLAAPAASAAVGVATDAAAFVYGHIAAMRASRSLEEALSAAQPAVDRIAAVIVADSEDLDELLLDAEQLGENNIRNNHKDGFRFRRGLVAERDELYRRGAEARLPAADLDRLQVVEQQLALTDSWYAPAQAELTRLHDRVRLARGLVQATSGSVRDWAGAHRQALAAVRDKRQLSASVLAQSVVEVRELIRRVREL
jgi:hypothetical protein